MSSWGCSYKVAPPGWLSTAEVSWGLGAWPRHVGRAMLSPREGGAGRTPSALCLSLRVRCRWPPLASRHGQTYRSSPSSVITGHTPCEGFLCPDSPLLRTPVMGLKVHSAIMAPLNLTPSKAPICIKSHSLIPRVRTSPLGGKEAGVVVTVLPKTAPISGKDDGCPLWLLT